jgi:regulator of replication initiation timing
MRSISNGNRTLAVCALFGLLPMCPYVARAQATSKAVAGEASQPAQKVDIATIVSLLQSLQADVRDLRAQVKDLKIQQESALAESVELRKELEQTRSQLVAQTGSANALASQHVVSGTSTDQTSTEDRIAKLEENQELVGARIAEQDQTKVESASKYRARLSGIVLFNTYGVRGSVDNVDFPQLAIPRGLLSSSGSLGASVRQSQIGIQGFGPTIAGARTSADIEFDFAGGFPEAQNGASFGIMRLRTGTVRFDWTNTSVIGGQDSLFFSPLSPTSIATLAIPALAYSGNLWSWTPQLRIEHRFALSDSSSFSLQGGVLDNLTGDPPPSLYERYPSWGEYSGQPAYATRLSWTRGVHGQDLTIGAGGYYSRQLWGFGRSVDGWAGSMDLKIPFGKLFEFTSQFYRGRAVGGVGGAIGQSVLWNGSFSDPNTQVHGLESVGGWAQLKYKATPKLQFNCAFGQDNPFASNLRNFGGNGGYYGVLFSRNRSALVNFIYQPRSDFVFSLEYRRLNSFILDSKPNLANLVNFSVGYTF